MFYIPEFLSFLKDKFHYNPSTIQNYRYLLARFERYCREKGIPTVKSITGKNVLDFLEVIKKRLRSEHTHYNRLCSMQIYFDYLQNEGFIFLSPLRDYRLPKCIRTHHPILSQVEIESILEGISDVDDTCRKGKVMLELFYSSALRPREIIKLKIREIDNGKGELFISQSKMKRDRIVPVGKKALTLLNDYINTTRKKYLQERSPENVFLDFETGKPHTDVTIRKVINHTLEQSGFEHLKPYSLRGTAATVLFLNGMGLPHLSKFLGHSNFSSTKIYLRLDDLSLRKELEAKHPRLKIKEDKNGL